MLPRAEFSKTYQFQLKVLAKFCNNDRTITKVDTTRYQVAVG